MENNQKVKLYGLIGSIRIARLFKVHVQWLFALVLQDKYVRNYI
jgi:hypothetical protein